MSHPAVDAQGTAKLPAVEHPDGPSAWALLRERPSLRRRLSFLLGRNTGHWLRLVMNRRTRSWIEALGSAGLDVLEVSGRGWSDAGFRSYRSLGFEDYDVCAGPLTASAFDLVILEQVLEHVRRPQDALVSCFEMLRPGGHLLVTTPFLVRIHPAPEDYTRWTPDGLGACLADAGFERSSMRRGAWGNRQCLRANLDRWAKYRPFLCSLRNEAQLPLAVWVLARRPADGGAP